MFILYLAVDRLLLYNIAILGEEAFNSGVPRKGEMIMPQKTAAQKKAQKAYMERFVRVEVRMTPDRRDSIQKHAQSTGESVTVFINRAIDSQMERDASSGPTEAHTALSEAGRLKLRPKGVNLDGR